MRYNKYVELIFLIVGILILNYVIIRFVFKYNISPSKKFAFIVKENYLEIEGKLNKKKSVYTLIFPYYAQKDKILRMINSQSLIKADIPVNKLQEIILEFKIPYWEKIKKGIISLQYNNTEIDVVDIICEPEKYNIEDILYLGFERIYAEPQIEEYLKNKIKDKSPFEIKIKKEKIQNLPRKIKIKIFLPQIFTD